MRARSRPLLRLSVLQRDRQFTEVVRLAQAQKVPVHVEPRQRLDRLVPHGRHQGVVALVAAKAALDEDQLVQYATGDRRPAFLVVLDHIQDPQNLGAVIRSTEAAGAHGLFIPERRAVGLTASVAKASAGALEYVRVARCRNVSRLLERLNDAGVTTCAFDPKAAQAYTEVDLRGPVALVFGVEGMGIRPGVLKHCTLQARIPMAGRIASLNLSVTVGIVLFEVLRQRGIRGEVGEREII